MVCLRMMFAYVDREDRLTRFVVLRDKHVRAYVDDRRTAHVAHVIRGRERRGAVNGATVVPDHQVADLPFVAVDELRLCGEFDQLGKQRLPLLNRHADDVLRVRSDIEGVTARAGMPAY